MKNKTIIPVSGGADPKTPATIQINLDGELRCMIEQIQASYIQSDLPLPIRRTQICIAALRYGLLHIIQRFGTEPVVATPNHD
jgi:hypothetical protein